MRRVIGVLWMLGGCASVRAVDVAAVPPPWPAPVGSAVQRGTPAPPPPAEAGKPPVPPQKNDVVPSSPTPPRSGAVDLRRFAFSPQVGG